MVFLLPELNHSSNEIGDCGRHRIGGAGGTEGYSGKTY